MRNAVKTTAAVVCAVLLLCAGCTQPTEGKTAEIARVRLAEPMQGHTIVTSFEQWDALSWPLYAGGTRPELSEDFFYDRVVVVIYLTLSSGSYTPVIGQPYREGDTLVVPYRIDYLEEGTCDIAYHAIVLQMGREDAEGVTKVTATETA